MARIPILKNNSNKHIFGLIFCLFVIVIIFVFWELVPGMAPYTILNSCFLSSKFLRYKMVNSTYFTVCHSSVFYYFTVPNTSLLFRILLHSRKSKLDVEQQTTTNTKTLTYSKSITTPPIAKIRTTIVIGRKFYTR